MIDGQKCREVAALILNGSVRLDKDMFLRSNHSMLVNDTWRELTGWFPGREWFETRDELALALCLMAEVKDDIQREYHSDPDGDIEGADYV